MKIRGGNQYGEVPINYVCHRCHNPGHWIKNCPNNNTTAVRSIVFNITIFGSDSVFFFRIQLILKKLQAFQEDF